MCSFNIYSALNQQGRFLFLTNLLKIRAEKGVVLFNNLNSLTIEPFASLFLTD